jgi:hypothetical protein
MELTARLTTKPQRHRSKRKYVVPSIPPSNVVGWWGSSLSPPGQLSAPPRCLATSGVGATAFACHHNLDLQACTHAQMRQAASQAAYMEEEAPPPRVGCASPQSMSWHALHVGPCSILPPNLYRKPCFRVREKALPRRCCMGFARWSHHDLLRGE